MIPFSTKNLLLALPVLGLLLGGCKKNELDDYYHAPDNESSDAGFAGLIVGPMDQGQNVCRQIKFEATR